MGTRGTIGTHQPQAPLASCHLLGQVGAPPLLPRPTRSLDLFRGVRELQVRQYRCAGDRRRCKVTVVEVNIPRFTIDHKGMLPSHTCCPNLPPFKRGDGGRDLYIVWNTSTHEGGDVLEGLVTKGRLLTVCHLLKRGAVDAKLSIRAGTPHDDLTFVYEQDQKDSECC